VVEYQVFRGGSLIGTSASLAFTDTGLAPSTSYTYTVKAKDAAQNLSPASTSKTITTQASGSGGQSLFASDDFNRPNGGPGPNWTVIDSDPRIVNNHVQESYAGDGWDSIAIYTALTWPANYYSQVTVLSATPHSGCSTFVRAKNDPNIEMYFAYVTGPLGPNARITLAKFVSHIYTELWSDVVPVYAGDKLYVSVNFTELTVKLNGNTLAVRNDSSITAAGYPGFDITDYDGQGQPGDGQCDDWEGGSFGAAPPSAPPVPTGLSATAPSSTQVNLTWTASTGATGYHVYRNGVEVGTSLSTSYADSGLSLGTVYTYRVSAYDADDDTSALSQPVTITTPGDTSPPTIPANLSGSALSSTQVGLSWAPATDNVGVVSYRVLRDGIVIGTPTATSFTDGGLTPATSYQYRVAALDQAGNVSAASAPITVTTSNAPPPAAPVVAFAFDEGAGLTCSDASSNGYDGTLMNGAGWSSGHTSSAVVFDGLNDWVGAGDIAALDGLTRVSVSAWIKGSVGPLSPAGVLVGKDAAFALVVVNHKLMFGVKTGGQWLGFPASSTSVDDGAFHYVTGVYDGSQIRVYVDGLLEATANIGSVTLNATSTPLQIASCLGGPNCASDGEMWAGIIDDVRVYNRALSAAEISADMNDPVN
jgi:chitodextrinase